MELRSLRFPKSRSTLQSNGRPSSPSSSSHGEEKISKDKNLHSPAPSKKWPSHLQELYKNLSSDYSDPTLSATINLLHKLKLNSDGCNFLRDNHIINFIAAEIENRTIFVDANKKWTGATDVLKRVFQALVTANPQAAKRFANLCDKPTRSVILETTSYHYMLTQLPNSQMAEDLFVLEIKNLAEGDDHRECVEHLGKLLPNCPQSAYQKVLKLLNTSTVQEATKSSETLASEIEEFRKLLPAWTPLDESLALLTLQLNAAILKFESQTRIENEETVESPSFSMEVAPLLQQIEAMDLDKEGLRELILTTCPGSETTQRQAEFVGIVVQRFIQNGKIDTKEDFCDLLRCILDTNMPARCAQQIATRELSNTLKVIDAERKFNDGMDILLKHEMPMPRLAVLASLEANLSSYDQIFSNVNVVNTYDSMTRRIDSEIFIEALPEHIKIPLLKMDPARFKGNLLDAEPLFKEMKRNELKAGSIINQLLEADSRLAHLLLENLAAHCVTTKAHDLLSQILRAILEQKARLSLRAFIFDLACIFEQTEVDDLQNLMGAALKFQKLKLGNEQFMALTTQWQAAMRLMLS